VIGYPLEIKFHQPVDSQEHPTLVDLSLVWNHIRKEYGLTYVTREHPYLQDRHDDIYISLISAGGAYIAPYERNHIVNCPGDCEKTSLTYNTNSGEYAFSYLKNDYPNHHVMIGLYFPGGTVREHTLMTGWNPGWGRETRIVYDPRSSEYIVVALKDKPGTTGGHEICYQIAGSNGTATGAYYVRAGTDGYDEIVSISSFLSPIEHVYLLCASEQGQIHCWTATDTGFSGDGASALTSVNGVSPSLSVIDDATYLSWSKKGNLYFGGLQQK